jgi:hypothetical protein
MVVTTIIIIYLIIIMFYIWHTLLIAIFVATAFGLGYKLGQKKLIYKKFKFEKILSHKKNVFEKFSYKNLLYLCLRLLKVPL